MGLFSWGKKKDDGQDALARRVIAELRTAGHQATYVGPDELRLGTQRLFLENLRRELSTTTADPETLIRGWARAMATPADEDETLDDIRHLLYPRIQHLDMYRAAAAPDAVERVLEDAHRLTEELIVLPAVDRPTTVETRSDLDALGGWETVWPIAMANLRTLAPPAHQVLSGTPEDGDEVHLFESDDFFGATRVLAADEVLANALGAAVPAPHGMLVGIPSRHILALHVLSGPGVVAAIQTLTSVVRADLPGPLSDRILFRAPDGTLSEVSRNDPDGSISVTVSGAFEDAMRAVGNLE